MGYWAAGTSFIDGVHGCTVHIQAQVKEKPSTIQNKQEVLVKAIVVTHDGTDEGWGVLLADKLSRIYVNLPLKEWLSCTQFLLVTERRPVNFKMSKQTSICN